jgi:hypothetical protein
MAGESVDELDEQIAKTNPLADCGVRIASDLKVQKQTHFFAIRSLLEKWKNAKTNPLCSRLRARIARYCRVVNRKNKAIKSRRGADFFKCCRYRRTVDNTAE